MAEKIESIVWIILAILAGILFVSSFADAKERPADGLPGVVQQPNEKTVLLEPYTSFWGESDYSERVGYYIAGAGDVNADSYGDFMVAAYHHSSHGWNCGGVYFFLGGKHKTWGAEEPMSRADALLKGSREYEMVGYNIDGKGDFNGDGFDDLLIGAPGTWDTNSPNKGLTYIVLGKANPDWGDDFLLATQTDISYIGELEDDQFGYAVNFVGDLNGDGCDDILSSAAFKTIQNDKWTGKVYLILGKKDGFNRNISVMNEAAATFVYPAYEGTLGFSVAGVGDVNGDGRKDFLMASQGIGTAFLMFGRPEIDWGYDFHLQNADVVFMPENPNDNGGWQVKGVGDVNGDGFDDFAITGVSLHWNCGKVYLIFGRSEWNTKEINLRDADASFIGENSRDDCGMSIDGVDDFDGDGLDDFIFGARYYSRHWPHSGKEYLIRGRKSGWERDYDLRNAPDYFAPDDSIYCTGWGSAGIDDYNGDSRPDFIVSAPFNSNHNLHWNGRIYLFYGNYSLHHVSGNVQYANSEQPVTQVKMELSGTREDVAFTGEDGLYEFPLKPGFAYVITPAKDSSEQVANDCISAYDAAMVARSVLELEELDSWQQIAADVDVDQKVSLFDAALILRQVVELPPMSNSHINEWTFEPNFYEFNPVSADCNAAHFSGIVRGDVDLNWPTTETGGLAKSVSDILSVPKKIEVSSDQLVTVPVELVTGQNILALEAHIKYDSRIFEFVDFLPANWTAGWTKELNTTPGQVHAALFNTREILAQGLAARVIFRKTSSEFEHSNIEISKFQINNLPALAANVQIESNQTTILPKKYRIRQNYPNPFQGKTAIQFELPQDEFVALTVYNLLGQEVYRLADNKFQPGIHSVQWSGKNLFGDKVPAGIYYYEIKAGNFRKVRKLVLLP